MDTNFSGRKRVQKVMVPRALEGSQHSGNAPPYAAFCLPSQMVMQLKGFQAMGVQARMRCASSAFARPYDC
jgi:hypothetical protein